MVKVVYQHVIDDLIIICCDLRITVWLFALDGQPATPVIYASSQTPSCLPIMNTAYKHPIPYSLLSDRVDVSIFPFSRSLLAG